MILLPCVLTRSLLPFPPFARGVCRDGAGSSRRSRRRVCVAVVALVRYTEMCVCVSVWLCVCVSVCVHVCDLCVCVWTHSVLCQYMVYYVMFVCVHYTHLCVCFVGLAYEFISRPLPRIAAASRHLHFSIIMSIMLSFYHIILCIYSPQVSRRASSTLSCRSTSRTAVPATW
jgi:hypothetical protein